MSIFQKLKIKAFFGALRVWYKGELHFGFNSRIWRVFIGKNGYSRLGLEIETAGRGEKWRKKRRALFCLRDSVCRALRGRGYMNEGQAYFADL